MSLYLKYRPQTLEDVKGNINLITSLQKLLQDKETCPHTFLFTGPSGCGKTTIARIIAAELGSAGLDIQEMNSADFRGIDTARELIKNCQYHPVQSECKVYIIDESHKLTNDAQNAMLKILEDTPKKVYFILCTTNPEKLIPTIKSRCIKFQVEPLQEREMLSMLRKIVSKENGKIESREVYQQIIEDSQGHPRMALTILEQVLHVEPAQQLELSRRAAEEQSESIELCRALFAGKSWKIVSEILENLKTQEPESVRRVVLGYCANTLLKKDAQIAGLIMEEFIEPFYNTGFPGLVFACYSIIKN